MDPMLTCYCLCNLNLGEREADRYCMEYPDHGSENGFWESCHFLAAAFSTDAPLKSPI